MEFQEVWNKVAKELPADWEITVSVDGDCNGSDVQLFDQFGDQCEFPSNCESLEQQVLDALEYAQETASK